MSMIKRLICAVALILTAVQGMAFSAARVYAEPMKDTAGIHYPEAGGKTKSDNMLTVDYTHMDEGYVMVRAKKCEKRMQLRVEHGADRLVYEMNSEGRYETIPLQMGSGEYRFTLLTARNKGGSKADYSGTVTLKCRMKDDLSCFLYPNQYVNYDADSPLVEKAQELCEGIDEPVKRMKVICRYVRKNFMYDWLKHHAVLSNGIMNQLPDIADTWETGMGVCQDLSALTCAMLRSQGIPAKLVIGSADGNCHAWVEIIIGGEHFSFDPSKATASHYQAERYY